MERSRRPVRGVAILALAGVLMALALLSPVSAAITKKKVKAIATKIATNVFNQNIGPATAGFLGNDLEIVTEESPVNNVDSKNAVAECPAGKVVVSSGVGIRGDTLGEIDDDELAVQDVVPTATTVTVTGVEAGDADYAGGLWSVTAYAVCATP